jgi:hypothetical protein
VGSSNRKPMRKKQKDCPVPAAPNTTRVHRLKFVGSYPAGGEF